MGRTNHHPCFCASDNTRQRRVICLPRTIEPQVARCLTPSRSSQWSDGQPDLDAGAQVTVGWTDSFSGGTEGWVADRIIQEPFSISLRPEGVP
jgi:hypothetical protein